MIRIFPPDQAVPEPEFRGMHHLPASALRNVLEQLYALPVTVSYDLRQVSQALGVANPALEGADTSQNRDSNAIFPRCCR